MIGIVAVAWVGIALHTGLAMRRYGRRWWVWFLISVCFTVVPATVVSYVEYFRQLRRHRAEQARLSGRVRCPHCRAVLTGDELRQAGGRAVCPRCNMVIDDDPCA